MADSPLLPTGHGDITNPRAWQDISGATGGASPPTEYENLAITESIPNGGFPNNGDGRYFWSGDASSVTGAGIAFIGDPAYMVDTGVLVWQILQAASDGSAPQIKWSQDGGATWTTVSIGTAGTAQAEINASGTIDVPLATKTGFAVQVITNGGTPAAGSTPWIVGLAIVRNQYAVVPWDGPNPWNPISYNAIYNDLPGTDTLANLRVALMNRLGFANQATNPPPGMTALVNQFLADSQKMLYRKYPALHMRRLFRWKLVPGIRFYSLKDNDEDVLSNYLLDPSKTIIWAGMQDERNVWYPLIEGIPPTLYTMIAKPWRPARYEVRQSIEVYPVPDKTYWLWIKGHFGLLSFAADTDVTTIDANLVYLHALANGKAHYGQPDANNIMQEAQDYLGRLIAGTHGSRTYVPGTIAVPPAIRPTLIQYEGNQNS